MTVTSSGISRIALVLAAVLAVLGIGLAALGVLALANAQNTDRKVQAASNADLANLLEEQLALRDSVIDALGRRQAAALAEQRRLRLEVMRLGGDPGPEPVLPPIEIRPDREQDRPTSSSRPAPRTSSSPSPTATPRRPAPSPSRTCLTPPPANCCATLGRCSTT